MERKFSRFEERKIVSESLILAHFGAVKEVQEKSQNLRSTMRKAVFHPILFSQGPILNNTSTASHEPIFHSCRRNMVPHFCAEEKTL